MKLETTEQKETAALAAIVSCMLVSVAMAAGKDPIEYADEILNRVHRDVSTTTKDKEIKFNDGGIA